LKKITIFLSLIISLFGQPLLLDQPDFPDRQTIIDEDFSNGINMPDRLSKSGSGDWRPIAEYHHRWENNSWVYVHKIINKYSIDELKDVTRISTYFDFVDGQFVEKSIYTTISSPSGATKSTLEIIFINGEPRNNAQTTVTYDANEHRTEFKMEFWNEFANDWKLVDKTKFVNTYDSKNNIIEIVEYAFNITLSKYENPAGRLTYTYDSNNNMTEWSNQYYSTTGNYIYWRKYTYSYDTNNNRTKWNRYNWENGDWIIQYEYKHTYDSNNQLTESIRQNWENDIVVNYSKRVSVWDASLNEVERIHYNWDENYSVWQLSQTNLNSYDSNNNQVGWVVTDGYGDNVQKTMYIYWNILGTNDEQHLLPKNYTLHENYPNPFNPTTTLRFDLPEVNDITLTIYNMLGQKVKTFNMQSTPAGYHSVKWNATNDYGDPVGAGVYLYQLQTKDFVKTRKMVLLK